MINIFISVYHKDCITRILATFIVFAGNAVRQCLSECLKGELIRYKLTEYNKWLK